MDSVVVTGGAGFVGASLVRLLLARTKDRVVVFDALTYAGHRESLAECEANPRFAFVLGDVSDRGAVAALYRDHRPRWVVNLAAESHVDRSIDGPRAFLTTNVLGVLEMLEGARLHVEGLDPAAKSKFRFLHVSTDEVYGSLSPDAPRFTEDSPYCPRSPYSASKAAGDHLVRSWHETYGLPTLLTNCGNNVGPYQFPEKLIPLAIRNALEGKPIPLYGDGLQVRDWIHVSDHAEGILAALERGRPGERYLFGADGERSNRDVLAAVCAALEEVRPARENVALVSKGVARYADLVTKVADRPGHDRRYAIDASRARRDLGWAPRRSFDEAIRSTVRWYVENAAWCDAVEAKGYRRERLGLSGAGRKP